MDQLIASKANLDDSKLYNLKEIYQNIKTSKSNQTAVQKHITATNHQRDLSDFEVIGRDSLINDFFLKVKESLLIKRHKPKLNENEASTPLFLF